MHETEKLLFDKVDTHDLPATKKTQGRSKTRNCCGGTRVHKSNARCNTKQTDLPARKTRPACRKNSNTFLRPIGMVLPSRTKPTGLHNVNRQFRVTPDKPRTAKRNVQMNPKQQVKRLTMKTTKHGHHLSRSSTSTHQSTFRKPIWLEERQRISGLSMVVKMFCSKNVLLIISY